MAIPVELKFGNEAEFVGQFVMPLLGRLGYSIIASYHSPSEFGKDIVFADFDKFGQVTYHAIQAKYVESISKGDSTELINQCKEAYAHPFQHPHTGEQHRINSFYVLNAGTYSQQARENFFRQLENPLGGSIRLIDGPALVLLDRFASTSNVAAARHQLSGLRLEQLHNLQKGIQLQSKLQALLTQKPCPIPVPIIRLRHVAIDAFLASPIMPEQLDASKLLDHAMSISELNVLLDAMFTTPDTKTITTALGVVTLVVREAAEFARTISQLVEMLGPLASSSQDHEERDSCRHRLGQNSLIK